MVLKFFDSVDQVEVITRLRRHSKYSDMPLENFVVTVVTVYNVLDLTEQKLEDIKHDVALIIDVQG